MFSARLDALADALGTAMQELASALRAQAPPGPMPSLRPLQAALKEHGATDASVLVVTDALVDAVDPSMPSSAGTRRQREWSRWRQS